MIIMTTMFIGTEVRKIDETRQIRIATPTNHLFENN
jgi:hypothetical protein